MLRIASTLIALLFLTASGLRAQESRGDPDLAPHTDRFADIAETCLADAIASMDSFGLDADPDFAFIETRLTDEWMAKGLSIYNADTPKQPEIRYRIDAASMTYERTGRHRLERTARLSLTWSASGADGRVMAGSSCSDQLVDSLSRDQALALTDNRFPVTQPVIPGGSRIRRILEPVVLVAASAVGAYLFFNLRSRRADSR